MYGQQSINRHQQLTASDPNAKPTLFAKMFDPETDGLSNDDIRQEAQGYIVAGSDTTAVSLTYLVYSVCSNDHVRRQLLDELAGVPEQFTYKDLRNLPYLNQVIDETLRLYTAVPSPLPREVPPEGACFGEYRVPGQVTVSTQSYSLHRDPEIFPDPHR